MIDVRDDTLVLIGCGSSKRDSKEYSFQLYDDDYFAKKVALAVTIGEPAVLSAEHGIVYFDEKLEPYDTHISDLDKTEVESWAADVSVELGFRQFDKLVLLLPQTYIAPLEDTFTQLEEDGVEIVRPFESTEGIGEQFALLTDGVEELRSGRSFDKVMDR